MKRYFRESEYCMGEFPGMQYEIFPSSQGEGFYKWDSGHGDGMIYGEGKIIKELGAIYGMEGEAILVSIDSDSIERV